MATAPAQRPEPASFTTVSWKAVALPTEHGGWGLLGEPLLVGLALAPTWAGLTLLLAAAGGFLTRHPLKLVLADRRRRSRYPRTVMAERLVVAYGVVVAAGTAAALALAGPRPLLPLIAVAPLAMLQVVYDSRLQGRRLLPELAGGIALAALAPAVMLAGGWPVGPSLAAGVLLAAKGAASILYVRARLRLDRAQQLQLWPALLAHLAMAGGATALALADWAPWLAVAATVVLAARAAHGLSRLRRVVRPQVLGLRELGYGVGYALALVVGYILGW